MNDKSCFTPCISCQEKDKEIERLREALNNRESVAIAFIGQLSFGLLPNGDHVEGAVMEYAEKILEKLK